MLEMMIAAGGKKKQTYPGPGGKELVNGNDKYGYCGTVTAEGILTQDDLITQSGVSAGTKNSPPGIIFEYFKFVMDGKVLYIPKFPVKSSLSWRDIYVAGCLYGTDNNGLFPAGSTVTQNKRITIPNPSGGEYILRFRVMKVFDQDPYVAGTTNDTSEFYRLLGRMIPNGPNAGGEKWGNFTFAQLGWEVNPLSWALNTHTPATSGWLGSMQQGGDVALGIQPKTTATFRWWPVLELLPN